MENNQLIPIEEKGEIVLYQPDDNVRLEVRLQDDTVWLTQQQMTELFKTTKQNVSLHINNIFREGEMMQNSVVKESLTTAGDGKNYRTKYYNLDVIKETGGQVCPCVSDLWSYQGRIGEDVGSGGGGVV